MLSGPLSAFAQRGPTNESPCVVPDTGVPTESSIGTEQASIVHVALQPSARLLFPSSHSSSPSRKPSPHCDGLRYTCMLYEPTSDGECPYTANETISPAAIGSCSCSLPPA